MPRRWFVVGSILLLPTVIGAQSHAGGHDDPVASVVLELAVILAAAKLAGHLAVRIGQPAVLGELLAGVALRLSVGIGMIPRGEVGLIFANIGLGLMLNGSGIVDGAVFSAIVIMVIATAMVTPPALKWSLSRSSQGT